jgi:radical SAM superfamily enzyme YgiQ (UPF0313 family)
MMINKRKIILYSPASFKHVRDWEKSKSVPIGLLAVASMIPLDKYEVKIYEGFPDMQGELLDNLKDALCVGISVITGVQIHYGLQIASQIKKKYPELPIIWGGYHSSIMPEQTVANNNVDIVVRGYGERTFAEMVESIACGKSLDGILGITYKKDGVVYANPDREIEDINNFPALPYHLIDLSKFIIEKDQKKTIEYISSRGCPFNCGFCADAIVYKRKWNCLSSERVIKDLEWLSKHYDFEAVRFLDSNLFVDENRISEICLGIIRLGLKFSWINCNGTASILRKYSSETWGVLHKANCKNILIGAESGFPLALKIVGKPSTVEDTIEIAHITKKYNISVTYSFMFGFPYDLPKEQLKNIQREELVQTMRIICKFIKAEGIMPEVLLFKFTPYPGSPLFKQSLKMGFIPPNNLEEWGKVTLDEVKIPWVDRKLDRLFSDCLFQVEILFRGDRYLKQLLSIFAIEYDLADVKVKRAYRLLGRIKSKICERVNLGSLNLPLSLITIKKCLSMMRFIRNNFYFMNKKLKLKT